jgi:hypothetical protein
VWWSLAATERRPALVLAQSVGLGEAIEAADLREVSVALDGTVDAIPATEASTVIGTRVTANLPAGVLLPRGALGAVAGPSDGRAIAALELEPGQAPQGIVPGVSVLVVLTAGPADVNANAATQPSLAWPGLVTSVATSPDNAAGHGRVVSVELTEDEARRVAAAPTGRLSLVVVAGGDR